MESKSKSATSKKRTLEMMESDIMSKLSSKKDWYQYLE
jgi:hypothetical protein